MVAEQSNRYLRAFLLACVLAAATVLAGGVQSAFADDLYISTPPAHQKTLTPQADGSYEVTLTVEGETDSSVKEQYADVLVVMDTSSSMITQTPQGEQRIDAAKTSVNMLADTLFAQNAGSTKVVNMALLSFNRDTALVSDWTDDKATYQARVNSLSTQVGTNWEKALAEARRIADARSAAMGRPMYVIFVTDGIPTQRTKNGEIIWDTEENCYHFARPHAKGIVDAGYKLYTVGIYGHINNLQNLTNYAYTGDDNGNPGGTYYYSAQDTPAFQAALSQIAEYITREIAYKGVKISDAIDSANVSYVGLGEQPDYVLKKELYDGTVISYDSTTGTLTGGSWNYGLPVFSGDSLSWSPEANPNDTLTDDAVYSISFKVMPTQDALDAMAAGTTLVNGDNDADGIDDAIGLYSNDNDKAYVSFSTIITTTQNGHSSSTEEGPDDSAYNKPVIPQLSSRVTVKKSWSGDEAADHADKKVFVQLQREYERNGAMTVEDYGSPIELSVDNDWEQAVTVPAGLSETTWSMHEITAIEGYATSYGPNVVYAAYGPGHLSGDVDGVLDVTNVLSLYDLRILKSSVDADGYGNPLAGAEFTLFSSDGATVVRSAKATAGSGLVSFDDIRPGSYLIRETAVPAGYQKLGEDLALEIKADGSATIDGNPISADHQGSDAGSGLWIQVDIQNKKLEPLPETGGRGPAPYFALGLALMACGGAVAVRRVKADGRQS